MRMAVSRSGRATAAPGAQLVVGRALLALQLVFACTASCEPLVNRTREQILALAHRDPSRLADEFMALAKAASASLAPSPAAKARPAGAGGASLPRAKPPRPPAVHQRHTTGKPLVLDAFLASHEVEMVRYRLALHAPVVGRTIIAESNYTYTAEPKRTYIRDALTQSEIAQYNIRLVFVRFPEPLIRQTIECAKGFYRQGGKQVACGKHEHFQLEQYSRRT
jgi:hypothetical protein